MSWFGETFGDSLTSLKGQITKITKEVLADDESSTPKTETDDATLRELQALCDSKDVEISCLKEDYEKLQSQLETFKTENENLKNHHPTSESKTDQLTALQTQIAQLTQEKNHLNSCIDNLQSEYETNLCQVVSIRDNYKRDLENLKVEHIALKSQLDQFIKNQNANSDATNTTITEETQKELKSLRDQVESLQSQISSTLKEQQDMEKALVREKDSNCLIRKEAAELKVQYETLKENFQSVCKELESLKMTHTNMETELEALREKNEMLTNQLGKSTNSDAHGDGVEAMEENLIKLLKLLDVNHVEGKCLNDTFKLVETSLTNTKQMASEKEENMKKIIRNLEVELKKVKEQHFQQQNELKQATELWAEREKTHQDDLKMAQEKLEEATDLKVKLLEMEKQSQIHSQSQTDDVKRLEQEVSKLHYACEMKTNEIAQLVKTQADLEQELSSLRTTTETAKELSTTRQTELKKLEDEIASMRAREVQLSDDKRSAEEKWLNLVQVNKRLEQDLERSKGELAKVETDRKALEENCEKGRVAVSELQKAFAELQEANVVLKKDLEESKAQVLIRESNLAELMKSNVAFQNEIGLLQMKITELKKSEEDCERWKNMSIDLELQIQDLNGKMEALDVESVKLRKDLALFKMKEREITQLRQANDSLAESCDRLQRELESKMMGEEIIEGKEESDLRDQTQIIADLREENSELKSRIEKFQEQMKIHVLEKEELSKGGVQQHRRSKSDFDPSPGGGASTEILLNEIAALKGAAENERIKYESLVREFQGLSDREANARKEFERLKQHLIEVEDHYTEEAVENEKTINNLKSKLMVAEEQLSNSSTLYTSAKIRDNQHVESLQNQLRLVGAQRDDFQAKLSKAEDEIQKHKASLTSLQIVLEQFQQDKDRELEGIGARYEKQLESARLHYGGLEVEIEGLQKQLSEAKNGLQAASRLGEQLERKSQQLGELENRLLDSQKKVGDLEESLKASNQSISGKVDKSLIKNLVAGYILSPNGDRRSQVLRILASVLDFDQEERNKMGVDASTSGWLASILHPKAGGPSTNESLSEAFIKFLESESRPQPQLNLLPEQLKTGKARVSASAMKPQGVFTELVLPTFNSPQESESSVILKSVLKDS